MKLEIVCLFLILFSVITIILGIVKIHTYPGKIAEARNHPQKDAIDVTSLLGLIIFPFWMVALIWAYSGAVIGILYEPPPEEKKDDAAESPTTERSDSRSVDDPSGAPAA